MTEKVKWKPSKEDIIRIATTSNIEVSENEVIALIERYDRAIEPQLSWNALVERMLRKEV